MRLFNPSPFTQYLSREGKPRNATKYIQLSKDTFPRFCQVGFIKLICDNYFILHSGTIDIWPPFGYVLG